MQPLLIYVKYQIGDSVCLKTDPTPFLRLVVSYTVSSLGVMYNLDLMGNVSCHYDFEIESIEDLIE